MKPEDLAHLKQLKAKATPGLLNEADRVAVESVLHWRDVEYLHALVNQADELIADSEALVAVTAERDRLKEALTDARMKQLADLGGHFATILDRAEKAEAEVERLNEVIDGTSMAANILAPRYRAALERIADYPGSDGLGNDEPDSQSMAREALGDSK